MFENKKILHFIEDNINKGKDLILTTVIETKGSTYAKAGNIFAVNSDMEYEGVLGSKYLHEKIFQISKEVLESKELRTFDSIPKDESSGHGTSKFLVQAFLHNEFYGALGVALDSFNKTLVRSIKQNSFEVIDKKTNIKLENEKFYQSIRKPFSLLIFGSGAHVKALIDMANILGWDVSIIDIKIEEEFVKDAKNVIKLDSIDDIYSFDFNSFDAATILSHSPKTDEHYLKALLDSSIDYIGMMGNKKNMARIRQEYSLENEKRFFAPIGLDIGSNTSEAIALSICAQIEANRHGKI